MMNIEQLLKAAEFLERREREAEHGYASTLPLFDGNMSNQDSSKMGISHKNQHLMPKTTQGTRNSHNELEKSRRQHLRYCMDELKKSVPLGTDSCKHTTLGLLTKAKAFIKALEEKERKQRLLKEDLESRNRDLKSKIDKLMKSAQYRNSRAERTISECSGSTAASTSSASSSNYSEDDVDVLGSDSEELINGYGTGVVVTTRQLSLMSK